MKIFLVDKNSIVGEFIEEFLKEESHSIFQYSCAECAIKEVESIYPDLIISGARLGEMDGMDFLKTCRNVLKYDGLFFILTSYPLHPIEHYIREGANLYLDKNIGYEKIFNIIKNEISRISIS